MEKSNMVMDEPILAVKDVRKSFREGEEIVKGVSFAISTGEFTVLSGASGSGKSTLLNIMSGLAAPSSGAVLFMGEDIVQFKRKELLRFRRNDIGHIFQHYHLLPYLTVEENIRTGLSPAGDNYPLEMLASLLGITDILTSFPSDISGGQQQRTAIARALLKKPKILYCDEATGALDEENSRKVLSLLRHARSELNVTVLFITHNREIAKTANRVIVIRDGLVAEDRINPRPLRPEDIEWG